MGSASMPRRHETHGIKTGRQSADIQVSVGGYQQPPTFTTFPTTVAKSTFPRLYGSRLIFYLREKAADRCHI